MKFLRDLRSALARGHRQKGPTKHVTDGAGAPPHFRGHLGALFGGPPRPHFRGPSRGAARRPIVTQEGGLFTKKLAKKWLKTLANLGYY